MNIIVDIAFSIKTPYNTILEFGSRKWDNFDLRNKFYPYVKFIGFDKIPGAGVDVICFDEIPSNYFDLVICSSVLGHDVSPEETIKKIKSSIKHDTGVAIITVPFYWWIHSCPSDYRRYTQEGLSLLLGECNHQCFGVGKKECPHTVIGIINGKVDPNYFNKKYPYEEGIVKGSIKQLLPPILFNLWKKCKV